MSFFKKLGLKDAIAKKALKWASKGIAGFLEKQRTAYPERNPNNYPVQIHIYNKQLPPEEWDEEDEPEHETKIAFVANDWQNKAMIALKVLDTSDALSENPMIGNLAPVVTNMMQDVAQEEGAPIRLIIANDYPKDQKPSASMIFINENTKQMVQKLSMREIADYTEKIDI